MENHDKGSVCASQFCLAELGRRDKTLLKDNSIPVLKRKDSRNWLCNSEKKTLLLILKIGMQVNRKNVFLTWKFATEEWVHTHPVKKGAGNFPSKTNTHTCSTCVHTFTPQAGREAGRQAHTPYIGSSKMTRSTCSTDLVTARPAVPSRLYI